MGVPKLALALGSGGARGLAHIGVIKALEEHGIPIHAIAGTSMGSLIGAFYVTGMTTKFMEQLATTLRWKHWTDFTVPKMGIISGNKVHQMLKLLTRELTIEETNLPFAVVATDLLSKKAVIFRNGLIADAVRASISIPGVFVPFVREDGIFVDGGVAERVPVAAARGLGGDIVIGVDVGTSLTSAPPENMMDVIMQSLDIMQEHLVSTIERSADVWITPDVSNIGTSQFHKAREAIEAGYQSGLGAVSQIAAILEMHRLESS